MDVTAILALVGGIALLVAIFGGGVEVERIKIPSIHTGPRIISALTGITLISIAIFLSRPELLPPNSPAASFTATPEIASTNTPQPVISYSAELCGEDAYEVVFFDDGELKRTNMTFAFPNGYTEGFITSDPGTVEFSDGQAKVFTTQFILITSGFSLIKVNGVVARQEPANSGNWVPNSYGCVFFPQDAHRAESYARKDYQMYVDANIKAALYRVTLNGFELLASNE